MSDGIQSSIRARLGASIATISVFSAGGVIVFQEIDRLRPYMTHSMLVLGCLGAIAVIRQLARRHRESSEEEVLRFYENPAYWGRCLLLSALLTYLVTTCFFAEAREVTKVAARKPAPREEPPPVEEPPVVEPAEEPVPEFPILNLNAVVLNGGKSTALINGQTVQLGETIQGVKVVDIVEAGIVVEMLGQRRIILRQGLQRSK